MEADLFPAASGHSPSTLVENPINSVHKGGLRDTGASLITAQQKEADISLAAWRENLRASVKKKSCKMAANQPPLGLSGLSAVGFVWEGHLKP